MLYFLFHWKLTAIVYIEISSQGRTVKLLAIWQKLQLYGYFPAAAMYLYYRWNGINSREINQRKTDLMQLWFIKIKYCASYFVEAEWKQNF